MYEGQTQKERRVLSMSRYFDTFFSDKNRINLCKSVISLTEHNVYNKYMIVTRKIDSVPVTVSVKWG